jgi:hypothetical protein
MDALHDYRQRSLKRSALVVGWMSALVSVVNATQAWAHRDAFLGVAAALYAWAPCGSPSSRGR